MAQHNRRIRLSAAAIGLLLCAGGAQAHKAQGSTLNQGLSNVHIPVVSRTDYVIALRTTSYGLARGEADRLAGWFDGLRLGYGDTVTVDDPWERANGAVRQEVGAVVSDYGMLVSHDAAPITIGHPAEGMVRVIVSRARADVAGCPDWSRGNFSDYAGSTMSDYGCATATNMASMVANPEDLIQGRDSSPADDAMLNIKAIKTYRDADATGKGGLMKDDEVSNAKVSSGGN